MRGIFRLGLMTYDPNRSALRPSYPPPLSIPAVAAEQAAYDAWWEADSRAQHILTARISDSARLHLVHLSEDLTNRTARAVYQALSAAFA
ncbi:hypothetical protein NLJ89_g12415 [Agrocybe chaxingu]|uniref:Uncharacterized protein n=1 Tax=Agrocybe chaxingu TaxID=84603 RepID=A0A9W8MQN2_9AGAR|nr:hypothetical protein NLJ89_g12415 [Agrocybe chaxingu]